MNLQEYFAAIEAQKQTLISNTESVIETEKPKVVSEVQKIESEIKPISEATAGFFQNLLQSCEDRLQILEEKLFGKKTGA